MGSGQVAGHSLAEAIGANASPSDRREAAAALRAIVGRLALPGHVAGYLRGIAECLDLDGAPGKRTASHAEADPLAGYVRAPPVASGLGIDEQRRTILAASGRYGVTVTEWYEDAADHAKNTRRGGLRAARSAIAGGAAHGIVVAEVARLGRNSLDVLDLVARAHDERWRVVAVDCRFDSSTEAGAIVTWALVGARRSEWRKVATGPAPTRARPARSASRDREVAVPKSLVNRITAMRADGESYRAIAAALNRDGVRSASGGEWHATAIRSVLRAARGARPGSSGSN
ncbi:MAG TPA: recombinase family protein [Gaiellales bacterium]|jgi:DNA invertase Pin-like site-specific DNA recombinase